jgi:2-polyprenyl-6-hydroxyphenyl methylase / 3-demethylubiquinone-9 3-methyltransferase
VPVDNQLYDRLADTWWDEDAWLHLLRTSLNPARIGYLRDAAAAHGIDPSSARALDVGCGGGLMAEDVARMGFRVTGVDPSTKSLQTAREHARASGLDISYLEGPGERLPLEDAVFDLVYCCDVLEHVDSVPGVLREVRRVIRPGGLFVYDTINRTPISKLLLIKVFQEWESTRLVDPGLHDHAQFIKPRELERMLGDAGFEPGRVTGMKPKANPIALYRLLRARKRGDVSMHEFAQRAAFALSRDTSASYLGTAVAA